MVIIEVSWWSDGHADDLTVERTHGNAASANDDVGLLKLADRVGLLGRRDDSGPGQVDATDLPRSRDDDGRSGVGGVGGDTLPEDASGTLSTVRAVGLNRRE
jgi:hypothetical protein